MITNKHITKVIAVIMVFVLCLCIAAMSYSGVSDNGYGDSGITMEYETVLFDTDEPIDLNIIMDDDDWNDMIVNALSETYYECDVELGGTRFNNVGIRPKGNTSLSSVVKDEESDRVSLKLEFDHYVDGQTCFGLDKLILNNNYADATNMKEALIYDMFKYMGADSSLYNYAAIHVNGEYWGVYLALEAVEESFLLRNYGTDSGSLYKPDSMDENGEGRAANDNGNIDMNEKGEMPPTEDGDNSINGGTSPDMGAPPEGGPDGEPPEGKPDGEMPGELTKGNAEPPADIESGMNGAPKDAISEREDADITQNAADGAKNTMDKKGRGSTGGANLNYTDDELDSYSTIWEGAVTDTTEEDHQRVVTALKNISEGVDLERNMDVDNILKYMAVHVFSVNDDSLSGNMAHNYILYEKNGMLNILPWDYNLSFGGMGGGNDASKIVNDGIDNAFTITDFFDELMDNEEYNNNYYEYLTQLVDGYINGGAFDKFYSRTAGQLDTLAENDPTAFYSYEEYKVASEMLYKVVKLRGESIKARIAGEIPSEDSNQMNSKELVDCSEIDLSVMGGMGQKR